MTLGFQTLQATKLRGSALLLSLDPYLCIYYRSPLHVSLVKSATKPPPRAEPHRQAQGVYLENIFFLAS